MCKPLLELKESLWNLSGCLFINNYVEAEMAAHTAKCVGSVQLFSSELLIEYACKACNNLALVECPCNMYGRSILVSIIHLMSAPEGNSEFCFPKSLNVSRDEVEGNIESRGKTKPAISRGSRH